MTRVLVTGALGLLGTRVCAALTAAGHPAWATARSASPHPSTQELAGFRACDLVDQGDVEALVEWATPEVIIHTAAMTDVDACERDPQRAFRTNVDACAWLALAARRCDAHVVGVSTDYVFRGDRGPYAETDTPDPEGVYALTKHMGEQALRALAPTWSIARTCVVFGWPPSARPNFGSWLVGELSRGRPVPLFEDQAVTPTWVDNAAAMVAEVATGRRPGVWHTAGAECVTRTEFGYRLCALMGFDAGLVRPRRVAEVALAAPRPLRAGLATGRVQAELSAKPLALDQALAGFAASWKGHA